MKKEFLTFAILCLFISIGSFAQDSKLPIEEEKHAVLKFEETTFDFGTIESGDIVTHVYTFTNTGDTPLIISNAKGSCGCVVPYFPKEAILPGETNEIEVKFNSKNKKGKQAKRITITANTNPTQTFLTIKGNVLKTEEAVVTDDKKEKVKEEKTETDDFFERFASPTPVNEYEATEIEFENPTFEFGTVEAGEKVSYVYKFTNTGDKPLIISNAKGSCGCTVPYFPKDPIQPGETSEIEIEFNTKNKKGKQSKRITITANTNPAQTFLTVKGEVFVTKEDTAKENNELAEQRTKAAAEMKALNPSCFAIYPNPTNEVLQLELKEYIGKSAEVEIRNKMGQKMMGKKIDRITRETTRFDVSSFSAGTYMISIRVEDSKPLTQCFVVTNK